MANIPVQHNAKVAYDAKKDKERERAVRHDIAKIDQALENNDEQELKELHRYLDGKYQACIVGWGQSMYGFVPDHGFSYKFLDVSSLRDNLLSMKPKLEGFVYGWNETRRAPTPTKSSDVNVTVNNTVNISISFDETRQKIEDMTALSREQTDEILEKINELEEISKESSSRKDKWEKVKPIIRFALDKGTDVAIAVLSLVMQMKLGM